MLFFLKKNDILYGSRTFKNFTKMRKKKYSKKPNLIISKSREKTQLINHLIFFSPLGGHRGIGNACKIRSNLLSNGLKNRPHLFHSACLDINKNSVFYICFPAWFIAILLSSNQFVCFTGSPLQPPPAPWAVWEKQCCTLLINTGSAAASWFQPQVRQAQLGLNMPIKCL